MLSNSVSFLDPKAPAAEELKMFANLIESDSHRKEFKRRSSFFLATVAAYAVVLFLAGIASIYAYDARLESLNTDITLLSWVPPVTTPALASSFRPIPRRTVQPNAPVDPHITIPERTKQFSSVADPRSTPEEIGTGPGLPPFTGPVNITNRNLNPAIDSSTDSGCVTCTGSGPPAVRVPETMKPPDPPVVKPKTQTLTTQILVARAISLPQPPYPPLAKQIHLQGSVPVQILVDEAGRVISAHAVSGHAFLTRPAEEAALRARFTPTTLNGQPVKVQGVITYNFILQ